MEMRYQSTYGTVLKALAAAKDDDLPTLEAKLKEYEAQQVTASRALSHTQ